MQRANFARRLVLFRLFHECRITDRADWDVIAAAQLRTRIVVTPHLRTGIRAYQQRTRPSCLPLPVESDRYARPNRRVQITRQS